MLSVKAQAKERGRNVKAGKFPFQANAKALGLGDVQRERLFISKHKKRLSPIKVTAVFILSRN